MSKPKKWYIFCDEMETDKWAGLQWDYGKDDYAYFTNIEEWKFTFVRKRDAKLVACLLEEMHDVKCEVKEVTE